MNLALYEILDWWTAMIIIFRDQKCSKLWHYSCVSDTYSPTISCPSGIVLPCSLFIDSIFCRNHSLFHLRIRSSSGRETGPSKASCNRATRKIKAREDWGEIVQQISTPHPARASWSIRVFLSIKTHNACLGYLKRNPTTTSPLPLPLDHCAFIITHKWSHANSSKNVYFRGKKGILHHIKRKYP